MNHPMNAQLRRTFYLFVCGFVTLVGVLAYWQVYARQALANNPNNGLQTRRAIEAPRGYIFASDGKTVLAESKKQPSQNGRNPTYNRVYPQGPLYAGVVGYWSVRYGATGVEIAENANLSGNANPSTVDQLINQVSGGPQPGNNVTLTLDDRLQRVAYNAIEQSNTKRGSIVAMNPKNGQVLAMASYPSYDPNNIDERFQQLANDPSQPLLNRATQGLYSPGSTFKVITAAAALKKGVKPTDLFNDPGYFFYKGYKVINYAGASYGTVNFTKALALSINVIFAKIAVQIVGHDLLYQTAQDFGYGSDYPEFLLPVTPSSLGNGDLAQLAFGQDTNVSNVFEMAQVASAIANGGVSMEPQIMKEVRSPDGVIIDSPQPKVRKRVLDTRTANTLENMMIAVDTEGDAAAAQRPGVEIACKTGTAENPTGAPNSWFIVSAPANNPKIAVAALIENGGDGGKQALPAAMKVVDAYLHLNGRQSTQQPGQLQQFTPQNTPQGLPQNLPQNLPQGLPQAVQQFFNQNQP